MKYNTIKLSDYVYPQLKKADALYISTRFIPLGLDNNYDMFISDLLKK